MTLQIQNADGSPHELDNTAIGNTIRSWWPGIAGDLAERGYPGAFLVDVQEPAPLPPVPQSVGKGQGVVWLSRAGKLVAVENYVNASSDDELKLWWKNCGEFRIDNPYVVALAAGFGIDLPTAFREAAAIDG